MSYQPRFYREQMNPGGLVCFRVVQAQTDLHISAPRDIAREAAELVRACRADLESFIAKQPMFAESYVPYDVPATAPAIVRAMADAARAADVGPMAAVAGAVADYVGRGLLEYADEVIVENGGDTFIATNRPRKAAIYAGSSPLSERVAVQVDPAVSPLGLCTSSATVGPSVSLGKADAAVVMASSAALADAVASAVGNRVRCAGDIEPALELGVAIGGVMGVLIIIGDAMGIKGKIEIEPV